MLHIFTLKLKAFDVITDIWIIKWLATIDQQNVDENTEENTNFKRYIFLDKHNILQLSKQQFCLFQFLDVQLSYIYMHLHTGLFL